MELTYWADKVISMRLHGLICAMAVGTPMLGISYDPKVDAFMEQAGLKEYCLQYNNFDAVTANRLLEDLDNMSVQLRQERETLRREMRNLALEPVRRAAELLE
jgi:polysaccharide pyruvyl transferase WcaK-like protein